MRRVSIVQGENAIVAEPHVVVSTLLGSCVAACLYDPVAKVESPIQLAWKFKQGDKLALNVVQDMTMDMTVAGTELIGNNVEITIGIEAVRVN